MAEKKARFGQFELDFLVASSPLARESRCGWKACPRNCGCTESTIMANCDARADRQCALGKANSWMSKWHQYCHPQGWNGAGRRFGAATISPDGGGAGTPIRRSVRPQRTTPASTDNAMVSLDELGRAMAAAGGTRKNGRLQPKDPQNAGNLPVFVTTC